MMVVVLGLVVVTLACIVMVQRSRIRTLRAEVESEARWAATYKSDAIKSNRLQCESNRRNRELADRVGDLDEQLRDARDEIERLARSV